jgi:RNA polymerase sigma-70 factor (ECF subfamily)
MISDESLMLEFQRGSRQAFEELFARYREPVHGFFRRRLDNDKRAEDLLQDTFLAVIRASSRYEPRALFRTYLYSIALKLLSAERRKQVTQKRSILSSAEPATEQAPEFTLWVRQALDRLDISDREVLMLREYEELSYAEIAELLRVPVNTVRSRLFRARRSLRRYLESEGELNAAAAAESDNDQDLKRTEGGV